MSLKSNSQWHIILNDPFVEKGIYYELLVWKHYESIWYHVQYTWLELGKKDGGIDLKATKNNTHTLIIQCKYRNKPLKHKDIAAIYWLVKDETKQNEVLVIRSKSWYERWAEVLASKKWIEIYWKEETLQLEKKFAKFSMSEQKSYLETAETTFNGSVLKQKYNDLETERNNKINELKRFKSKIRSLMPNAFRDLSDQQFWYQLQSQKEKLKNLQNMSIWEYFQETTPAFFGLSFIITLIIFTTLIWFWIGSDTRFEENEWYAFIIIWVIINLTLIILLFDRNYKTTTNKKIKDIESREQTIRQMETEISEVSQSQNKL